MFVLGGVDFWPNVGRYITIHGTYGLRIEPFMKLELDDISLLSSSEILKKRSSVETRNDHVVLARDFRSFRSTIPVVYFFSRMGLPCQWVSQH